MNTLVVLCVAVNGNGWFVTVVDEFRISDFNGYKRCNAKGYETYTIRRAYEANGSLCIQRCQVLFVKLYSHRIVLIGNKQQYNGKYTFGKIDYCFACKLKFEG